MSLQESINTLNNADLPDHLKSTASNLAWLLEAWKEIDDLHGTESAPEQVLEAIKEIRPFQGHFDKREVIDKLKDAYTEAYPERESILEWNEA